MNTIGLNVPPCGTPETNFSDGESASPILTLWDLPVKKDLNHSQLFLSNPYSPNLRQSSFVSTVKLQLKKNLGEYKFIQMRIYCQMSGWKHLVSADCANF